MVITHMEEQRRVDSPRTDDCYFRRCCYRCCWLCCCCCSCCRCCCLHALVTVWVQPVTFTLQVMFCSPEPEHWRYSRQRPSYLPRVEASSMESYSAQGLQLYQEDLPVVDWIAGLSKPSSTAVGRSRNLVKTDPATIVNTDNADVDGEAHRDSQSLSHSLRGGRRGLQNGPGPLPPSPGASSLEEPVQGGGGVLSNLGACDPYHEGDDWCSAAISPAESRALEIQGTEMYCSRECSHRGGRRRCNASCKRRLPATFQPSFF